MNFKSVGLNAVVAASVLTSATALAIAPAQAGSLVSCATLTTTCNLDSLITNGDFFNIDDDKQYSDFRVVFTGSGSPSSATDIEVGKSSVGSGISLFFPGIAAAGQIRNISLEYTLTALGNKVIDSMGLSMTSGVVGNGGAVLVKESIFAKPSNQFLEDLFTYEVGGNGKQKSDLAQFVGTKQVRIQKDIQLFGGKDGIASLSIVNQSTTAVPTPALLPGLVGMGIAALRRKQKATADQA
jgi:hypothetical protein